MLADTPMLQTASPFSTPPTVIQTAAADIQKSLFNGIGMAVGLAIGGIVWYFIVGRKPI